MSLQTHLDQIAQTDMDRREFIAYLGAILLAIFGLSNLLKTLSQSLPGHSTNQSYGYGGGAYGGKK